MKVATFVHVPERCSGGGELREVLCWEEAVGDG